jgi:hypothetical protein
MSRKNGFKEVSEEALDKLYERIQISAENVLSNEACLDDYYCRGLSEEIAEKACYNVEQLLDDAFAYEREAFTTSLPFLETIRNRYFDTLDTAEQRELEQLILELSPRH